jgi:hypothetical protein
MIWKSIVRARAIAPRRRMVATALVYGLSMAVRFTSAAAEETEVPPPATEGTYPMTSIMINHGGRTFYRDWPRLQPIAFHRGGPLVSKACRAGCESPAATPLMPGCSTYP